MKRNISEKAQNKQSAGDLKKYNNKKKKQPPARKEYSAEVN